MEKPTRNKTNASHQTFTGFYRKLTAQCVSLATKKELLKRCNIQSSILLGFDIGAACTSCQSVDMFEHLVREAL